MCDFMNKIIINRIHLFLHSFQQFWCTICAWPSFWVFFVTTGGYCWIQNLLLAQRHMIVVSSLFHHGRDCSQFFCDSKTSVKAHLSLAEVSYWQNGTVQKGKQPPQIIALLAVFREKAERINAAKIPGKTGTEYSYPPWSFKYNKFFAGKR